LGLKIIKFPNPILRNKCKVVVPSEIRVAVDVEPMGML